MDPIGLVRQATTTRTAVDYNNGYYTFGSTKLPDSTKTRFKRSLKSMCVIFLFPFFEWFLTEFLYLYVFVFWIFVAGGFYTLKDVIFFLQNIDVPEAEYRRKCNDSDVSAVVTLDKVNLKLYLTGKINTCEQLQEVATEGTGSVVEDVTTSMDVQGSQGLLEGVIIHTNDLVLKKNEIDNLNKSSNSLKRKYELELENEGNSTPESMPSATASQYLDNGPLSVKLNGGNSDALSAFVEADQKLLSRAHYGVVRGLGDRVLNSGSGKVGVSVDRTSMLCYPEANYDFVLQYFNDNILKRASGHETQSSRSKSNTNAPSVGNKMPIIIIPTAVTSLITAKNVLDFLCNNVFVDVSTNGGAPPAAATTTLVNPAVVTNGKPYNPRDVVISTTRLNISENSSCANPVGKSKFNTNPTAVANKKMLVRIVDNPLKLTATEWKEQVVAVFATGQAWQFKNWAPTLGYSDPVTLFQHVLGVHVAYDDQAVHPNVASWNCKVLRVSCNAM